MLFAIVKNEDAQNNRKLLNASTSAEFSHVRRDDSGSYYIFSFQEENRKVFDEYPVFTLDEIKNILENQELLADIEYEKSRSVTIQNPFATKFVEHNKSLYSRTVGKEYSVTTGVNTLDYDIPYAHCKISGIEVINSTTGDKVDFFVLDDDLGSYSTIPNYVLNQFGFDVTLPNDYYRRESVYDADLYYNMCVSVTYYSKTDKDVYINYILHEVK